jgi:hypothetical protein
MELNGLDLLSYSRLGRFLTGVKLQMSEVYRKSGRSALTCERASLSACLIYVTYGHGQGYIVTVDENHVRRLSSSPVSLAFRQAF